jgi:hypothetical protein
MENYRQKREIETETEFSAPVFTTPLVGPEELIEGQAANFTCKVEPVGDPDMKFQWYLNGNELVTG